MADRASADERQEYFRLLELPEHEALNIALIEKYLKKEQDKIALTTDTAQSILQAVLIADKQPVISTADLNSTANNLSESPYVDTTDLSAQSQSIQTPIMPEAKWAPKET